MTMNDLLINPAVQHYMLMSKLIERSAEVVIVCVLAYLVWDLLRKK